MIDPAVEARGNCVSAEVKLSFSSYLGKNVLANRSLEGSMSSGNKRLAVRQVGQLIKVRNIQGPDQSELVMDEKITDFNKKIMYLFGASPEIVKYVLFCHQDDNDWMFMQNLELKTIFDKIFDTEKFSKMMAKFEATKKYYKQREKDVRLQSEVKREKFQQMIGSMKELQRNLQSLKDNVIELEKEKQNRQKLQNSLSQSLAKNQE